MLNTNAIQSSSIACIFIYTILNKRSESLCMDSHTILFYTGDRNCWKFRTLRAIGIAGSDRNRWQRSESLEDDGFRGYPNGMAARRSNPRRQTCCSTLAGLPPSIRAARSLAGRHPLLGQLLGLCLATWRTATYPARPNSARPGVQPGARPGPVRRPCPQPAWYMHYIPIPGAPPGPSAQPDWSDPGFICILTHLRRRRRSSCASWLPCRSRPTRPPPACTSGR